MHQIVFGWLAVALAAGLWVLMMICLELGRRLGLRHIRHHGARAKTGVGVVDGAVYSLAALLLGFAFSGSASRYDQRRQLIAKQISTISTAFQRAELVAPDQERVLRGLTAKYMQTVLASYNDYQSLSESLTAPPAVQAAEKELWITAVQICRTPTGDPVRVLVLPALTDLFDAVEQERLARRMHPPAIIFVLIGLATMAAALFAGYGLAEVPQRNWLYVFGFTITVAITVYVILELEFPRLGLVRVDLMDRALRDAISTAEGPGGAAMVVARRP